MFWTFFSTIICTHNIPEYPDINDPALKSILKHRDHPSIKVIEKVFKLNGLFKFSKVEKGELLNEIVKLGASKSCQDADY